MADTSPPHWHAQFIRSAEVARTGGTASFYRAAAAGVFVKVGAGVYLPSTVWTAMSGDDRYLARIHGTAAATGRHLVFSHRAAAALWRLPAIQPWPRRPDVLVDAATGGRSRVAFSAHAEGPPTSTNVIDGLAVTTLTRTVIDVGRHLMLSSAVAMADRALAPKAQDATGPSRAAVTLTQLKKELAELGTRRGTARCSLVLDLADGASGSPGETLSRVGMHVLGLPAPQLQQEFWDSAGYIGQTDFWWPHLGLIGEFDGQGKYLRDQFLQGRTSGEVVIAEKVREDRLRALGHGVTRWGWDVARSLPLLRAHLGRAGVC